MPDEGRNQGCCDGLAKLQKRMKSNKILKSFAELSAESISAEVAKPEETKPQPDQMAVQEPPQTPRPESFVKVSPDSGYRHWGLNE